MSTEGGHTKIWDFLGIFPNGWFPPPPLLVILVWFCRIFPSPSRLVRAVDRLWSLFYFVPHSQVGSAVTKICTYINIFPKQIFIQTFIRNKIITNEWLWMTLNDPPSPPPMKIILKTSPIFFLASLTKLSVEEAVENLNNTYLTRSWYTIVWCHVRLHLYISINSVLAPVWSLSWPPIGG